MNYRKYGPRFRRTRDFRMQFHRRVRLLSEDYRAGYATWLAQHQVAFEMALATGAGGFISSAPGHTPPQAPPHEGLHARAGLIFSSTAHPLVSGSSAAALAAATPYFQSNGGASDHSKEVRLNKMFDNLRNTDQGEQDTLGAESTMAYLQSLGANLEDASLFIILEIVQAPSIGEITREGFVQGWKATNVDARPEAHQQYFSRLLTQLATNKDVFKKVYRYVFVVGKEKDQRALALDIALTYWGMLFSPPGQRWITASGVDFFEEWKAFLSEKWTRSVNKDMWNMTLEFAYKTMEDETMGFWSPDGAWPGVIDDFAAWYKKKTAMDVDA
ncbi:hypothetical protein DL764_008622 [Monosporascus ibericus]|uniref:Defective in cullin neddylation protein n=1 Tax=Monosporascus ibericus TaxID=155417 RepID=A0A4Q4SX37_9PEZI|nr:hypothetical protein DL764_008622 [Monosporascus ibericus]